jgi:hypothetical protein
LSLPCTVLDARAIFSSIAVKLTTYSEIFTPTAPIEVIFIASDKPLSLICIILDQQS